MYRDRYVVLLLNYLLLFCFRDFPTLFLFRSFLLQLFVRIICFVVCCVLLCFAFLDLDLLVVVYFFITYLSTVYNHFNTSQNYCVFVMGK